LTLKKKKEKSFDNFIFFLHISTYFVLLT